MKNQQKNNRTSFSRHVGERLDRVILHTGEGFTQVISPTGEVIWACPVDLDLFVAESVCLLAARMFAEGREAQRTFVLGALGLGSNAAGVAFRARPIGYELPNQIRKPADLEAVSTEQGSEIIDVR